MGHGRCKQKKVLHVWTNLPGRVLASHPEPLIVSRKNVLDLSLPCPAFTLLLSPHSVQGHFDWAGEKGQNLAVPWRRKGRNRLSDAILTIMCTRFTPQEGSRENDWVGASLPDPELCWFRTHASCLHRCSLAAGSPRSGVSHELQTFIHKKWSQTSHLQTPSFQLLTPKSPELSLSLLSYTHIQMTRKRLGCAYHVHPGSTATTPIQAAILFHVEYCNRFLTKIPRIPLCLHNACS